MANHLAQETSLYLRQHAQNPVDWYPWGDEALAEATRRDVPLFISIGYSACHWCHVMAHESFADDAVAQVLNSQFVSGKVDREERPDVDALYMEAVQALNDGHGGWPLTVFATPDGKPFFGGTYFPPVDRPGRPSFRAVADAVATAWAERRAELVEQADELTYAVASRLGPPAAAAAVPASAAARLDSAADRALELFDAEHGGFGAAPKFPQPLVLELLLRAHLAGRPAALEAVVTSLRSMAAGGIYDHLGGGFARYATDARWRVPHFEKMLYDQALLARVYLHAWQLTNSPELRQVLDETLDYVLRDLRQPSGGLSSAEDADSDGSEGRFYTWTPEEIEQVLGKRASAVCAWFGVTRHGDLEVGRSVLHRDPAGAATRPGGLERARQELLAARAQRVRPGLDDKVLTEWNAMACSVLAEAGTATGNSRWTGAAVEIAAMLLDELRRPDGRWMRSWQSGRARHLAVGTDYAWLVECFTRLAEATGQARFVRHAVDAAAQLVELFGAPDGGWYLTGADADPLVVRPRDTFDGSTPSTCSVAASALARLGALVGDPAVTERAQATVEASAALLERSPLAVPGLVHAALLLDGGPVEVVLGAAAEPGLVEVVRGDLLPEVVLAWGEPTANPIWTGRDGADDRRGYVCHAGVCAAPVVEAAALRAAIRRARLDSAAAAGLDLAAVTRALDDRSTVDGAGDLRPFDRNEAR